MVEYANQGLAALKNPRDNELLPEHQEIEKAIRIRIESRIVQIIHQEIINKTLIIKPSTEKSPIIILTIYTLNARILSVAIHATKKDLQAIDE